MFVQGSDEFDIETTPQRLPQKHVVAVRITSENASDGFKPTAGRVDEVGTGNDLYELRWRGACGFFTTTCQAGARPDSMRGVDGRRPTALLVVPQGLALQVT